MKAQPLGPGDGGTGAAALGSCQELRTGLQGLPSCLTLTRVLGGHQSPGLQLGCPTAPPQEALHPQPGNILQFLWGFGACGGWGEGQCLVLLRGVWRGVLGTQKGEGREQPSVHLPGCPALNTHLLSPSSHL